jgi:NAD(P)-dependent dehydrogenase (short-subunit alcohol dehydrogenase family)
MDLKLEGKRVLVTGSTRGIGKAIALIFAKEGAVVILHGKSKKSVSQAVEELKKSHLEVHGIDGDIKFSSAIKKIAQYAKRKFGGVDILVNNAGIYGFRAINEMTIREWQDFIDINLKAPFLFIKEISPMMEKNKWGRIINISSTAGVSGRKLGAHYNAAKGGLIAMTEGLAKDLGKYSITVNCVAPFFIKTENIIKIIKEVGLNTEEIRKSTPLNRLGEPEDIASVALFLASPLADFITGQTIVVNGGSLY